MNMGRRRRRRRQLDHRAGLSAQGKLLWQRKASDLVLPNRAADRVNRSVNFEGTPVADNQNVYVAVTDRREQTATYIACFDAETGARRYVRYLGAAAVGDLTISWPWAWASAPSSLAITDTACSRWTALSSTIRRTSAPWPRSRPRPASVRWVATYPRQDPADGEGQRPRPEPRHRARGPGHRRPRATPRPSSPSTPTAAAWSGRPIRSPTRSS